jgi:hypothetical protein
MHQPNRLPDLNNSRKVSRGSEVRKQQGQKSLASKPAPPKSTAVNTNNLQQQQVRQLHSHVPAPVWLKSLLAAQKVSMILFGSVFGLSSIVYGYTMHNQTTWRTQQDQFRRWQNQERQQGVMDENLKQDLAKTAETKGSGFIAPKPELNVFLHGASPRQPKSLPAPASNPTPVSKVPSGY